MNSKSNIIREELREIAPHLAEIQRSNPFGVPVHYFETLPDALIQKIQTEELSVLNSLKKDNGFNGFNIPYNYFESLPSKILTRIREEEAKPNFVDTILNKLSVLLKPQYAVGAIALMFAIIFTISKFSPTTNTPDLAQVEKQVSTQDISEYINSNVDQFDEKSIVACVTNKELDNAPFPLNSIDTLNLNNQNIIDLNQIDDNTIKEIAN